MDFFILSLGEMKKSGVWTIFPRGEMKIPRGKTNETLVGMTFLRDEVYILLREIVQTACKSR